MLTILKGLGYMESSINDWIKDKSREIYEEEHDIVKQALVDDNIINEDDVLRWDNGSTTDCWCGSRERCDCISEPNDNDEYSDEDYDGQFKDWETETPIEDDEEESNRRMDIIGQNGNEGTHYGFEWDDNIKGYEYESNDILHSINDSITLIKDRMEDIDMRMDNIDEQLGILNADVANIEYSIENPIKEKLIDALAKYKNDVVDMETGEVHYDNDGGFAVKMNKTKLNKGKIKELKK